MCVGLMVQVTGLVLMLFMMIRNCLALSRQDLSISREGQMNGSLVLELFHKDSTASPFRRKDASRMELLAEQLNADKARMSAMAFQRSIEITNPLSAEVDGGGFLTQIRVGTPARITTFLVDTGSELTWLQCLPCSSTCNHQGDPIFAPMQIKIAAPLVAHLTAASLAIDTAMALRPQESW